MHIAGRKGTVMIAVNFQMCPFHRGQIIEQHRLHVARTKIRMADQLTNEQIQSEAQDFAQKLFETESRQPSWGFNQSGSLTEVAHTAGVWHYQALAARRDEVRLEIVNELFDTLEANLSRWLIDRVRDLNLHESIQLGVRDMQFDKLVKELEGFGWDIGNKAYYQKINICRLIANVCTHGEGGQSFDELNASHPEYFVNLMTQRRGRLDDMLIESRNRELVISQEHIDDFAEAISEFWRDFPESLCVPIRGITLVQRG